MKSLKISTLIILATLVVVSCGKNTDTLEGKKERLEAARNEMRVLDTEVKELEKAIAAEDPEFGKVAEAAELVTTIPAAKTEFEHKIEVRGNVQSRTNVYISAEIMGQLTAVNVVEGQYVNQGQVLATIDSESIEKSIAEIENQLTFATTVFEKRERLWKQNIGTEIDYLQAKNNKESLEKSLETLKIQLDKSKIKAPFSGTIEEVPVNAGQVVQPGTQIAFLVSNQNMYILAEVSEAFIGKFQKGDEVSVSFPSLNKSFESTITSIGSVINQASRTFTVEVKLPADKSLLKTNLISVLKLTDYSVEDAVVIPSRVIQEDLEGNFVYTVGNGDKKAKKVHVKLGYSYDNKTEVLTGLAGGESVVDKGSRIVADGTVVSVQN
ncbi:MAG: efflux RND transporter periplasmic adaptor subunit [Cytophagia bacterium]|nr:efflux RND transporter periplasmic adaptor subunit [Cytophagia bacterium]